jgi:predicted permease
MLHRNSKDHASLVPCYESAQPVCPKNRQPPASRQTAIARHHTRCYRDAMIDVLSITGVIFILIAAGYGIVRKGVFSSAEMRTLGKFVVNLALPALVFQAVSSRDLTEIANTAYIGALIIGSLAVYGLGYFSARRISKASPQAAVFQGMGMSCANSGFVGYPVLLMALPDVATTALALNMVVENVMMLPLILIMTEKAHSAGTASGTSLARQIGKRLLANPILIGLVLGIVVSLSGMNLPFLAKRPIELFAASSAALSLVAIGGTLASLSLSRINPSVLFVVIGKLLLHPLFVAAGLGIMAIFGFSVGDPRLGAAVIIMSAMPVMSIYPILAQRFGEEENAAIALFGMTVSSFITITTALAIILPQL